jgi:hypothetical protein
MISIDTGIVVETARIVSPIPSAIAPPAMRRGLPPAPKASHSAASSDPTPDVAETLGELYAHVAHRMRSRDGRRRS